MFCFKHNKKHTLTTNSLMFMSVITSSSQQTHQFLLITSLLFLINKIKKTNKRIVMGLLLSRSLACKFFYPLLFSKKVHNDFFPQQLENMMCLVSPRTGRHLQRYEQGCRQVVGCVSLSFSCDLLLKIGFLMFDNEYNGKFMNFLKFYQLGFLKIWN